MIGIVSYGAYVPKYRIKTEEIARVWKKDPAEIRNSLGIVEKAVASWDEDAVTLGLEAAIRCLGTRFRPDNIGAILVGSETHPYAVNPTSTIIGEFLGIGHHYFAADLEFACKAGTAAIELIAGLIKSGQVNYGLAVGTDVAQSRPHDVLEYTSGAGAAAFLLGNSSQEIIAELVAFTSYSSDTPDFWRRDGIRFPSHSGRFSGEPAYFTHVLGAANLLFKKTKTKPADFDYCVFHMPNGKFPVAVASRLGFTKEQFLPSFVAPQIGNPYSASTLIGLASVLKQAKPDQKIFMVSYGSGAGSDAFIWKTTKHIEKYRKHESNQLLSQKEYIDYPRYLKQTKTI